jgi:hypothetical protein
MSQCPYKIHWGVDQSSTSQCSKQEHAGVVAVNTREDGLFSVSTSGDPHHEGPSGVHEGQVVSWEAGDRREYTGDWPGPCPKLPPPRPCTLHDGHHGRCAP